MPTALTTRITSGTGATVKNAPLNNAEIDNNFLSLNNNKVETSAVGTIASQNSNNVTITGGSISGITDLAITDGGTGAGTASGARTNLLPSYTGNAAKVLAVNAGATDVEWIEAGAGGGVLGPWSKKTANYTAVDGDRVLADSSAGTFTITLPATPTTGQSIIIADGANFSTTNVTVARNGSTVEGVAENLILDVEGVTVTLVYDGATWEIFASMGTGTASFATTAGTQTLTNKTLTDPTIVGAIIEDIFTITDGAAFEIDPSNGSIQLVTLGGNRTPKATNFVAGESVTLMVLDGSAFTLSWGDATFGGTGVVWVGGTAPTLDTTKYTVIELWKVGTQVYGALVGAA